MARKLPRCPKCGDRCVLLGHPVTGNVDCTNHDGCDYRVCSVYLHEWLCARLAEKTKRGKVLARGWKCDVKILARFNRDGLKHITLCNGKAACHEKCPTCRRVAIVDEGGE